MERILAIVLFVCLACDALVINNLEDKDGYPRVVPTVKEITKTDGLFEIPGKLTVAAPESAGNAVETLERLLSQRFSQCEVRQVPPGEQAACILELTDTDVPENPEGYYLEISQKGILVKSNDVRGLYYGVQTLGDILRNSSSPRLKCCAIRDWPDLEVRGVYFVMRHMRSGEGVTRVMRALQALGTMKINTVLMEFGGHMPFQNSIFPDEERHFTLEELEQVKKCAEDNHIEIIPLIQIISHDFWMRTHPDYLTKITARNVDRIPGANTWQVTNCLKSELARQVTDFTITETINLLKPRIIHLGLDEFEVCHWRECEHCGKHTLDMIPPLLRHYLELVKSLGVTPMVNHDELMTESSQVASVMLPLIPKDAIIDNWDYSSNPQQKIIDYFEQNGFQDFISMSYCQNLENSMNLPRLMKANNKRGNILSYWGYLVGWLTYKNSCSLEALTATALNAEACWNATGDTDFRTLDWDPSREMRARLDGASPARMTDSRNTPIPLGKSFNALIGNDSNFPKLSPELTRRIRTEAASTPEKFRLETTDDGRLYAIVLSGGNDDYQKEGVNIPLNLKATGLTFLMNTALPEAPGKFDKYHHRHMPEVARLKINYTNGQKVEIPLLYRSDINCWNSENSGYDTRFVLRCNDLNGKETAFLAFDWNNPLENETIDSIEFSAKGEDGVAPALYAISAYNPKSQIPDAAPVDKTKALEHHAMAPSPKCIRTRHVGADFENGIGTAIVNFEGEFNGTPKWEIITDETSPGKGKHVLKMTLPPQMKGTLLRSRAIVDLPMPKSAVLGSFFVDYRTPQAELIDHSGLYVSESLLFRAYNVIHGFHSEKDTQWRHLEVPFSRMTDEAQTEVNLNTAQFIRFSLWFVNREQPVTLYVDNIGVSPDDVDWPRTLNDYKVE